MNRKINPIFLLVALLLVACSENGTQAPATAQSPAEDSAAKVPLSLANPASVYCQYIGGEHISVTGEDGEQSSLCQLADGQSCEEWDLYRGSCSLPAEVSEPFAFCSAIGNSLVLPAAGGEQYGLTPSALLPLLREQGLVSADVSGSAQAPVLWRCMQGEVYVCPLGANLPCGEQADLSDEPSQAMQEFCADNPDADGVPAYITGRATVFSWSCVDGEAVVGKQIFTADEQGFLAEFWHRLGVMR